MGSESHLKSPAPLVANTPVQIWVKLCLTSDCLYQRLLNTQLHPIFLKSDFIITKVIYLDFFS